MRVNVSGMLGLSLFWFLVGIMILFGGTWLSFVDLRSLLFCLGVTAGLGVLTFGMKPFGRGIWTLRTLVAHVQPNLMFPQAASVLRRVIGHVYAAGVMGVVVSQIDLLLMSHDPSSVPDSIAASLLPLFYAILLAEGLFRPAARRIKFLLTEAG